jgi:hypothetical protein
VIPSKSVRLNVCWDNTDEFTGSSMKSNIPKHTPTGWRISRKTVQWITVAVVLLLGIRIALPYGIKAYVNHVLNNSADYGGRVGDLNLQLWRGGYQIRQIQIFQKSSHAQSPLFLANEVDLLIEWRELFHGSVVGQVIAREPRVNIVVGPSPGQTQNGKNESWDKVLESLFPFNLNRVEISDGEIHFKNPYSKPPVDIYTSRISMTATNLTNARNLTQPLPSGVTADATTLGGGHVNVQLQMNLLKSAPAFQVSCTLTNVNLVALNDFLKAYGKFDVERGNFSLYTSVAGDKGAYEGYFKVFFDQLDVFQWEKERKKNILAIMWQAIVGTTATIFENHSKDQLAAKVPITGTYDKSSIGVWTTIGTLLENAFIHALVPKLDQPVTVQQVEKKTGGP